MISQEDEKKLIEWAGKEAPKWRKKKINELMNKVKKGGKLTSLEKNILRAWQKMYGNR